MIGVGPSGTDISIDLTPYASNVSLLGAKEIPGLPKNIKMFVGWPKSVHATGIITNNNYEIECDSIIVSSGYQYDFSFLGDRLKLSECGKKGRFKIYESCLALFIQCESLELIDYYVMTMGPLRNGSSNMNDYGTIT